MVQCSVVTESGALLRLCTLAILFMTAPAVAQTAAPAPIPTDAEIRQMLVTRVETQRQASGIVVGIVDATGRRIIAFGTIAMDDKRPMGGDTVFDVGSITKVFTALLLSDMVQRGEVALDDPVTKVLGAKDLPFLGRGDRDVTLLDLATHTSGLPLRPANLVSTNPDDKYAGYTTELLHQFLASFEFDRDPGRGYEYSNVGYGLLGEALSLRSGASYRDLLQLRITQPLGMTDTRVDPTEEMENRRATGYDYELKQVPRWDFGALESAGGLRSTANDLLKLLEAILGYRSSSLQPAMRAMTAATRTGGMQPATHISLAWNVYRTGGGEIAWKNGSVGGFRTFIGYDPQNRVGVVALANAQTAVGVDDVGLHVLDRNLPVDLHVPVIRQVVAVDPAILDRYVGRYQFSPTDIVTITRDGERLFMQQPGQDRIPLFAYGEREFFLKIVDAQITFESSGDGRATAAIWHQSGQAEKGPRIE